MLCVSRGHSAASLIGRHLDVPCWWNQRICGHVITLRPSGSEKCAQPHAGESEALLATAESSVSKFVILTFNKGGYIFTRNYHCPLLGGKYHPLPN